MPSRIGHGPFKVLGLTWPCQPFKWLFYDLRPDLIAAKTRAPEWKQLNSQWRYFQALFCYLGPPSHILYNIRYPYAMIMIITGGAVAWQSAAVDAGLPDLDPENKFREAFRLTSFIMSLLLAFRLNRTYERWNLARVSVAGVGGGATQLFITAATYIKDPSLLDDFRRFCLVWPFSIKMVVEDVKKLDPEAEEFLFPEERAVFYASRKPRQVVLTKIRALTAEADLDLAQAMSIDACITSTYKAASDALRIKFQALPHSISLLCTGFVLIWCCLLPFGLSTEKLPVDWAAIISMAIVAMLLLAIDEVAAQLEDPFRFLPLDDIAMTFPRDIGRVQKELHDIQAATAEARRRMAKEAAAQKLEDLPPGIMTGVALPVEPEAAALKPAMQ